MAELKFKLPDIGEGVTEGEIVAWLVQPGDVVVEDQPMVEVMTDKATVTIAAPKAGRVRELRAATGEVVQVHSVLVVFDLDGDADIAPSTKAGGARNGHPASLPGRSARSDEGPAASAVGDIREDLPGMGLASIPAPRPVGSDVASTYFNDKPLATPATRKLARDLDVDLRTVSPSGPSGRVTKDDVRRATSYPPPPVTSASEAPAPAIPRAPRAPAGEGGALEERVPLKGVRKRIFENMARSKRTAAHFTFVEECDATALKALRERLEPVAAERGVKLSFLPFIVKAVVAALEKHPALNSTFDETTQEIVVHKRYDIGIAASTEAGLMVPVVKGADRLSILGIAREIQRLAHDAKGGKAKLEDLQGGTFTITSLGQRGGLFATPIVNLPEVAILGVHRIKEKPVVRNGQLAIGQVMLLSLSFDHRLIDGHVGAAFAYEVIGYLENPERLFLELA